MELQRRDQQVQVQVSGDITRLLTLVEFWDGGAWRDLQSEDIPPTPSEHFNTVLYTGTGSAQSITGVGFKPDWVWLKVRSAADNHTVFDSTRGVQEQLYPNLTNSESNSSASLTSFDLDGFTIGNSTALNDSGKTYVALVLESKRWNY